MTDSAAEVVARRAKAAAESIYHRSHGVDGFYAKDVRDIAERFACVVGLIEAAREMHDANESLWNTPLNERTHRQRERMERASRHWRTLLRDIEQAAGK